MENYGEEAEFEGALVAAYPDLLRFAKVLTGNHADAQDLVQDAIARGMSRRKRFQQGGAVKSWLATILRHIFIDRYRHAQVAAQLARRAEPNSADAYEEPSPPAQWEAFTLEDVQRALMFLPPSLRTAFTMFVHERLSYAEIGRRLSLPAGSVAVRIFRTRQKLRGLLVSGKFRLRPVAPIAVSESPSGLRVRPAGGETNTYARRRETVPYRAARRSQARSAA